VIRYLLTVPRNVPTDARTYALESVKAAADSGRWRDVAIPEGWKLERMNVVRAPSVRVKNAQKRLR
jgi:hypothetical protein